MPNSSDPLSETCAACGPRLFIPPERLMRTLTTLRGNSQKLDGGAMFGNAPKAL